MRAVERRQQLANSVIVISLALVCIGVITASSLRSLEHDIVYVELTEAYQALTGEGWSRLRLEGRCLDSPPVRYHEKDFYRNCARTDHLQRDQSPRLPTRLSFNRRSSSSTGRFSPRSDLIGCSIAVRSARH